jgi:hypothetical protein
MNNRLMRLKLQLNKANVYIYSRSAGNGQESRDRTGRQGQYRKAVTREKQEKGGQGQDKETEKGQGGRDRTERQRQGKKADTGQEDRDRICMNAGTREKAGAEQEGRDKTKRQRQDKEAETGQKGRDRARYQGQDGQGQYLYM